MPSTEGRLARDVSVLLSAILLSSILKCKSTVKRAERSHRVCASVGPHMSMVKAWEKFVHAPAKCVQSYSESWCQRGVLCDLGSNSSLYMTWRCRGALVGYNRPIRCLIARIKTRKPSLEVAATTSATFSSHDDEL